MLDDMTRISGARWNEFTAYFFGREDYVYYETYEDPLGCFIIYGEAPRQYDFAIHIDGSRYLNPAKYPQFCKLAEVIDITPYLCNETLDDDSDCLDEYGFSWVAEECDEPC